MGRRKLEIKRIEDKSSRQVTFSKRRAGLIKKARHLSVLCDVDIAIVIFSSGDKLYEHCSGSTDSVDHILSRYQKSCLQTPQQRTTQDMGINTTCTRFRTCNELLQSVRRVDEDGKEEVSISDMTELEEELNAALMNTRSRKTQLLMERISTFHQQEKKLSDEKEELKQKLQVASAANQENDVDDGGGDTATKAIGYGTKIGVGVARWLPATAWRRGNTAPGTRCVANRGHANAL